MRFSTKSLTATNPVTVLKGVGAHLAKKLERLHIRTVQDVLFHLPLRYQDRTRIHPIGSLRSGSEALIEGEVEHTEVVFRRRRMMLCKLADGTGSILLRFFYFSKAQQERLQRGVRLRCYGEVRSSGGQLEIVHPEYRQLQDASQPVQETLTPVYPATEGVQQATLRKLVAQSLSLINDENALAEYLPTEILHSMQYPTLNDALRYVHEPPPDTDVQLLSEGKHPAQQRMAFEELLAHHLSMRQLRLSAQRHDAAVVHVKGELQTQCLAELPFTLTKAQQRVLSEISEDMARPHPCVRLVQGDVGSGKTIIAVLAALNAIEAGYQSAVMAPTELLAEQHYQNFLKWLQPLGIRLGWLSGRIKGKEREKTLASLAQGEIKLLIGTHALFQEDVAFDHLALLIVDEQHRFGVHQRMALREKGINKGLYPHQITMTATPIPRTLAMTAYADLDYSVIDEMPPGRKPVKTVVLADSKREEVIKRIEKLCAEGKQVYWVCPLIEESETLQCQTAEDTVLALKEILPALNIGLVHGRIKAKEKEAVMAQFKRSEIDLLVATTVIEVGVDVPNASLMIIENAERFGLSQLHQLRGRVGRGAAESVCVMMYKPPLSAKAKERLTIMRKTNDGFEIAQKDLDMRGPGEVLGTRQTGIIDFSIADIVRDADLLPDIQKTAEVLLQNHPEQANKIIHRWLHGRENYKQV